MLLNVAKTISIQRYQANNGLEDFKISGLLEMRDYLLHL